MDAYEVLKLAAAILHENDHNSALIKRLAQDIVKTHNPESNNMTDIDKQMESDIEALKLEAPRIHPEDIDAMCEDITYECTVVPGTNATLCTAVYFGWTLCTVEMACVSKDNFNAALGVKYAIKKCAPVAKDELWKLEGWRLFQSQSK